MPNIKRVDPALPVEASNQDSAVSGKLQIVLELDDLNANEIRILKSALLGDGGIEEWVRGMLIGKINNRKKAMLNPSGEFVQILKDAGETTLPIDEDGLITMILDHPNYRDRVTRDAQP